MPGPADRAGHLVNDLEQAIRAGDPLTPRERETADLVSAGITNRAIATQLVLSERPSRDMCEASWRNCS
jgi:DNA-binding NarL/FixJ family response regulator